MSTPRFAVAEPPATATWRSQHVACPLHLRVETIARFLNLEIADHPDYDGLELQWFDDDVHGTGMLAFLSRREDRRVEYYVGSGLRLNRAMFTIGGGTASWTETEFDAARLDVAPDGVVAEVRFRDLAGRLVEVDIDDRDGHPRRRGSVLAPVSAVIDHPTSLLLVWMSQFDLVRVTPRPPVIRIGGEPVATGALPGARLHRRHLIKYAADLVTVVVNEQRDGPVAIVTPGEGSGVDIVGPPAAIAAICGSAGGHHARLELTPALPDPTVLLECERRHGTWTVTIDDSEITGGTWSARRAGAVADLELDVTQPWHPGPLPLLMRIVTSLVPTFRQWPPTYRWRGRIRFDETLTHTSRWERKSGQRGDAYRRLTRSKTR